MLLRPQMLSDLHVADRSSQVGFYSGIVDSVFSIAQLGSLYHFGRLSGMLNHAATHEFRYIDAFLLQTKSDAVQSFSWDSVELRSAHSCLD